MNPTPGAGSDGNGTATLTGSLRKWEPLQIDFDGPWATETDVNPNPFLDYRLIVDFEGPSGVVYEVPGFFAGNGVGDGTGRVWRVRFAPDEEGPWHAEARFRAGTNVAISTQNNPGSASHFNGATVDFEVTPRDPFGPGLWKWGWLTYGFGHYPKFREGPYFLKGGTNSPENILGYKGFDEVSDNGGVGHGVVHRFQPHVQDWNPGDPLFSGNVHGVDSKGIIGALNYLSSVGVNSAFAIMMNLGGDGQDAHPFVGTAQTDFNKTHYDIGRLDQWERVFSHAADKGIAMHFGLAETEGVNENWLDSGNLGVQRKMFYREMVARFGHLPAIKWDLCEETDDYSVSDLREFADYIAEQDVYQHAITFHNLTDDLTYHNIVAGETRFSATANQYTPDDAGDTIEYLRDISAAAGHPWVVQMDENNPWFDGLSGSNTDEMRKRALYDVFFSGGHIEWYLGWHQLPLGGDVNLEDFRTREDMWIDMKNARNFIEAFLPFWEMEPSDQLLTGESSFMGGGEVFAKPGEVYAVYLPDANPSGNLNLNAAVGDFRRTWWNPRTGNFEGNSSLIPAGSTINLGSPPSAPDQDWVILFRRETDFLSSHSQISVTTGADVGFSLVAGPLHAARDYIMLGSFSGTSPGFQIAPGLTVPLNSDRYTRYMISSANTGFMHNTMGTLDATGRGSAMIEFPAGVFAHLAGSTVHHAFVLTSPQTDYVSDPVVLRLFP